MMSLYLTGSEEKEPSSALSWKQALRAIPYLFPPHRLFLPEHHLLMMDQESAGLIGHQHGAGWHISGQVYHEKRGLHRILHLYHHHNTDYRRLLEFKKGIERISSPLSFIAIFIGSDGKCPCTEYETQSFLKKCMEKNDTHVIPTCLSDQKVRFAIEILAELINAASERSQVIVSTQSPALIGYSMLRI
ncbi:hypothetical protein QUF76_07390 [Desulfobacterales bacterium HSG16]|nr:hypothetical protein [Desulfobacterales bacterium HSG16]